MQPRFFLLAAAILLLVSGTVRSQEAGDASTVAEEFQPFDSAPEPPQVPDTTLENPLPDLPLGMPAQPEQKFIRATNSFGQEIALLQNRGGQGEVEISDAANKRKAIFYQLSPQALGAALGFEEVPISAGRVQGTETVAVFAIDPSQLQFETATLSAVATGHYLYKCRDWNFYLQQCAGSWEKIANIIPGQEYSVPLGPSDPAYSEGDPLQNFNASDAALKNGTAYAGTLENTNMSDGSTYDIQDWHYGHSFSGYLAYQNSTYPTVPNYVKWHADPDEGHFEWHEKANASAVSGNVQWVDLSASPIRNETILGSLDSLNDVQAEVWNGSAWSAAQLMTATAPLNTRKQFDVEHEQLSGDAVFVYLNGTNQQIQYRVWNGTSWSAEQLLTIGTAATANTRVKLFSHAGSDELMLLVETVATSTYSDLYASYWDGTSFGAPAQIEVNIVTITGGAFDGAWEDSATDFVLFYADTASNNIKYRNYTPSVGWANEAAGFSGGNGAVRSVVAENHNGTENVMACWQEFAALDLDCQMWDGTQIGTGSEHDTGMESYATTRNFDVAPVRSTNGGFVVMYGDQNDDWFDFYLCTSTANCFAGTYTTAANTPIALWSTTQLGGTDTSWGSIEADAYYPGNLTLVGASQTAGNGWYRTQIYCDASGCSNQGNWVQVSGTTSVAYEGARFAFDKFHTFRTEAWHNSTPTSVIPSSATIYAVNATVKFNSTVNASFNLSIYNWTADGWTGCNEAVALENSWTVWSCNVSATPTDFFTADADKRVRIMLNGTQPHAVQSLLKEDYVKYFVAWDAPPYFQNDSQGFNSNTSAPLPGDAVKMYSLWFDDTALSNTTLESNITGALSNQTFVQFSPANASWSNWSIQVPASQEGKVLYWRAWANDSKNFWNKTDFKQLNVQNVSPTVAQTFANESDALPNSPVCINASATDAGVGLDYVFAMVRFPNGTSFNYSMSDTGCNAGGPGDGRFGVQINTGSTPGNVTVNTTYSNDTLGNLGWQSPLPQINVSSSNPPYYNTTGGYLGMNDSTPQSGDAVKFFSYWYDDVGLKQFTLEWNASGTYANQTWLDFSASNDTWANYSIQIPSSPNNRTIGWRIWANGSRAATPLNQFDAEGSPLLVNGTYVNVSVAPLNGRFCVNASAGDAGSGIDLVWAMITFQNGTQQNITLSDTGCNAGGAGDNNYGNWVNASSPGGNITINTTYANNTLGGEAFDSPFPNLQVMVANAIGGSDYYVGVYGKIVTFVRRTAASQDKLSNASANSGSIYLVPAGAPFSQVNLKAASAGTDMPAMDSALSLSAAKDLLENNYDDGTQSLCGVSFVNYLLSRDGNWKIGALYSDESAPSGYSAGDVIIFCTEINYGAQDAFGTTSDYELAFPKSLASNVDVWYELS